MCISIEGVKEYRTGENNAMADFRLPQKRHPVIPAHFSATRWSARLHATRRAGFANLSGNGPSVM
ncbi:hypothetical protein E2C01_008136 [Portunus trituberculatus]|uniref:Uncharacterized protein n=1 Tax=Portunus trituberculatus TaxID=210409 RepID=A0A5B7D0Z4_PORTR|nr:hypothetical protein [Portunus trituberculatus]